MLYTIHDTAVTQSKEHVSVHTSRTTSFDPLLEDFLGFSEDPAEELLAAAAAGDDAAPASCITVGTGRTEQQEERFPKAESSGVKKAVGTSAGKAWCWVMSRRIYPQPALYTNMAAVLVSRTM